MSVRTFLADESDHAAASGPTEAEAVQFQPIIEDDIYHGMLVQSALERVALFSALEDCHCAGRTGQHVTLRYTSCPRRDRCRDHSLSNISTSFFENNQRERSFSLATARRRTLSDPVHRI